MSDKYICSKCGEEHENDGLMGSMCRVINNPQINTQITQQESPTIRQQLAEVQSRAICAETHEKALRIECDQLKQQLLASEASRERMRAQLGEFVSVYISCDQCAITGVERKRFEQAKQLLREPASLALSEALLPVIGAIHEFGKHAHYPGPDCSDEKKLAFIAADKALTEHLTQLDKLCPPPKAEGSGSTHYQAEGQ